MEEEEKLKTEKEEIQIKHRRAGHAGGGTRRRRLRSTILRETLGVLEKLDISYDLIVRESDILKGKLWEKTFELLKRKSGLLSGERGREKRLLAHQNAGCGR